MIMGNRGERGGEKGKEKARKEVDLRWIDDANHATLAMGRVGAVEPDWVGVVDCYAEHVGLGVC